MKLGGAGESLKLTGLPASTAWLDDARTPLELVVVEGGLSSFIERGRSADGLQDPASAARSLAEHLSSIFGATARAVLHYGSRAQGRASRPDSAFDFFVIVDGYRDAYRALAAELGTRYRASLAVALAWVLPPNAVSIRHIGPDGERVAKCLVISTRHFRRECSTRARDHFVRARLMQHVLLAWSRDHDSAEEIRRGIRAVREGSFAWARAFLPSPFDAVQYCRTLLQVSLAHEMRLEARDHAEKLLAAQRDRLLDIYGPLLARLAAQGILSRDGELYRQRRPAGVAARARVRVWFRWSKLRTTVRLLKHPLLYDRWLDYLISKIDRSTGERIELTERERRYPLVFLWLRAFHHLRSRPQLQR